MINIELSKEYFVEYHEILEPQDCYCNSIVIARHKEIDLVLGYYSHSTPHCWLFDGKHHIDTALYLLENCPTNHRVAHYIKADRLNDIDTALLSTCWNNEINPLNHI